MIQSVINILPDSVANQIAAGEVVQRPSSVVKELIENSIDAKATIIKVNIIDAGKTSIQIIDNGIGMSEIDARLAFQRHATSKISSAEDLFAIRTFGFRGEALASIAAVAQVELITKTAESELGTRVEIHGNNFILQEPVVCSTGSIFTVKNLFFNIPARRRFLKSDTIEFKHIVDEFQRAALAHPEIAFTLTHNGQEIYALQPVSLKQRILHIFGKQLSNELVDLFVDTSIIRIHGFIGKPEFAKKKTGLQFFFVNNRYIKHPLLYRAVVNAYSNLIQPEHIPSFFLFFECEPANIDVNIHPTKTEVKFEDERAISQILEAAIRQSLGNSTILPNIDFDSENSINIPLHDKNVLPTPPQININPDYNPFEQEITHHRPEKYDWKKLFETDINVNFEDNTNNQSQLEFTDQKEDNRILQICNKYILVPIKSGVLVIHQYRAHVRILYELFEKRYFQKDVPFEKLLFPEEIQLAKHQIQLLSDYLDYLAQMGIHTTIKNDETIIIETIPIYLSTINLQEFIHSLIDHIEIDKNLESDNSYVPFLLSLAKASAIKSNQPLSEIECQELFDNLFLTSMPEYTPDGKRIFQVIEYSEIDKLF